MTRVGGSERGQLLVVGGLALAVTLVMLGIVLNFAIYTENMATRDTNAEIREAVTNQQEARETVGRAMRYVNVHDAGSVNTAELEAELLRYNLAKSRGATGGGTTQVEVVDETMGTRMAHTNETKAFVSGDGDLDWTLATDVPKNPGTGRLNQTINRSALWEPTLSADAITLLSNAYHIRIEGDNGDVWRLFVFQDSDRELAFLFVTKDSVLNTLGLTTPIVGFRGLCPSGKKHPKLSIAAGTFGGKNEECDHLQQMWAHLAPPYDIAYRNVKTFNATGHVIGEAKGTYDHVVACTTCVNGGKFHSVSSGDSPFSYEAFYRATVEVTYRTSEVTLRSRVRTGPVARTTGFPGLAPTVTRLEVTDNSDPSTDKASYTVDWKITDRDEDLQTVNFTLVDKDCCIENFRSYDTSDTELTADSGSDTFTFTDTNGTVDDTDLYLVRVVAVDQHGNTVSEVIEDQSDGADP